MSVGFVMLAHSALDRAGDVALHLAGQGAPVVIHLDARTPDRLAEPFLARLAGVKGIHMAPRQPSNWGTWQLVDATLSACRVLFEAAPEVGHVCLISGSCIPLQSVAALEHRLAENPDADFIESVAIEDASWIVDGLEQERFTLTFPFSWKRHRRLFDAWVQVQRWLGLNRSPPAGLEPHLGSQWWCLTKRTLQAILADPELPEITRYFRRVWIPDESFFQTLARRHGRRLVAESPTLARFGYRGAPHLFYDDHIDLLVASGAFFARKIWPGADELYDYFLGPAAGRLDAAYRPRVAVELARSVDRRAEGRPGLVMPGRLPSTWADTAPTACPYTVLHGFQEVFPHIQRWAADMTEETVHGRLFAPDRAHFSDGGSVSRGCLTDDAALRDYDTKGFLRNLIWAARGSRQIFLSSGGDTPDLAEALAIDPHASIYMITGAWALALDDSDPKRRQKTAARLQRQEAAALDLYRNRWSRARVRHWTLADVIAAPEAVLRQFLDDHLGRAAPKVVDMPDMTPLDDLADRLIALRNGGMPTHLAGDVTTVLSGQTGPVAVAARRPS